MSNTILDNPWMSLFLGSFLGIISSIIAATIHPPLINYIVKIFRRKSKDFIFTYTNHGHQNIKFGEGENHFEANWSPASSDTVHLYNQRADTKVIGTIRNVIDFHYISDIVKYLHEIEKGTTISQGQFFILKNQFDKYAIVQLFNYQPGPIGGEGNMHVKYKIVRSISK
jgi:hypothetical protein